MGEVQLGLAPRGVLLGEVDILVRAVQRPPPEPVEGPVIAVAECGAGTR